ncbi:MAG: SPOR domain-containing protein, partial [Gemmatimonadota bacterium]
RVRLTVLELGTGRVPDAYACRVLQVGAFEDPASAVELEGRVESAGYRARREVAADGVTRVLAGPFSTEQEARAAERRFGGFYRACDAGG